MRLGVQRALRRWKAALPDLAVEIGFEVEMAEDGTQALDRIRANPPDVLLLDHKMPGMTGIEVLSAIQAEERDLLVIMITAYASIETAVVATKRGAYDFLPKPFTPDELKGVLTKATRHLMAHREALRLAEEKRQVRFEFISVLAHELKAPIGAIEGYLCMLRDGTLGPELASYAGPVERMIVRLDGMKKMIYDLLDLTRIESGKKAREIIAFDLREVAERAMETVAPAARERGITVALDAPAGVPVTADRSELEIVLDNLVSNAVKYNRDGGRVDVRIATGAADRAGASGSVTVEVADTGIGMAEADAARLFKEFVRIKTAKTRNILGSGLGLSIVKKLVDLYGGAVAVRSRPDEGTTFTVTLPIG